MKTLKVHTTQDLLTMLIGFIRIQQIALLGKEFGITKTRKLKVLPQDWKFQCGICYNIWFLLNTEKNNNLIQILEDLFIRCPSFSGVSLFPVQNASPITFMSGTGEDFWGNRPYADNRRQIITECIKQLQTELKRRKVNV